MWNFDFASLCFYFCVGSGLVSQKDHTNYANWIYCWMKLWSVLNADGKISTFPGLWLALRCKWKLIHKENRFSAFQLRITFQISPNFPHEIAFIDRIPSFDISIVGVPSLAASLVAHRRGENIPPDDEDYCRKIIDDQAVTTKTSSTTRSDSRLIFHIIKLIYQIKRVCWFRRSRWFSEFHWAWERFESRDRDENIFGRPRASYRWI